MVVWLSLAVELDGASPESLLGLLCSCDRVASRDGLGSGEVFGRDDGCKPRRDDVGEGATVFGIVGLAAFMSSVGLVLRLPRVLGRSDLIEVGIVF